MRGQRKTLPLPSDWRDDFKKSTFRTSFVLTLSRSMLEFLCAVSDDCQWDRAAWGSSNIHYPDNWVATGGSLMKRGLIVRMSRDEIDARSAAIGRDTPRVETCYWRLTPAGEKIVELLKLTGMFIESDAAIVKKARRKA